MVGAEPRIGHPFAPDAAGEAEIPGGALRLCPEAGFAEGELWHGFSDGVDENNDFSPEMAKSVIVSSC